MVASARPVRPRPKPNGGHRNDFQPHVKLGRLAVAALLAGLATTVLASSTTAMPTSSAKTQATMLQRNLDGLVASGIPGAILIVRNGNHTVV